MLSVPTGNKVFVVSSKKALRAAAHMVFIGRALPGVYYGFVDLTVLRAIKNRAGRFFGSMSPDYYSAFAVMAMTDSFLCAHRALWVGGVSAKSNGAAFLRRGLGDPIAKMFLEEGSIIPCHPALVLVDRVTMLAVAEPLLQVSASLLDGQLRVNMWRVISLAYRTIAAMLPEDYASRRAKLRDIAQRNRLAWFARLCERRYPNRPDEGRLASPGRVLGERVTVSCNLFAVNDVYDASLLAERFLHEYPLEETPPIPYTYTTALRERLSAFLRI
jgi:hypothetical protein